MTQLFTKRKNNWTTNFQSAPVPHFINIIVCFDDIAKTHIKTIKRNISLNFSQLKKKKKKCMSIDIHVTSVTIDYRFNISRKRRDVAKTVNNNHSEKEKSLACTQLSGHSRRKCSVFFLQLKNKWLCKTNSHDHSRSLHNPPTWPKLLYWRRSVQRSGPPVIQIKQKKKTLTTKTNSNLICSVSNILVHRVRLLTTFFCCGCILIRSYPALTNGLK